VRTCRILMVTRTQPLFSTPVTLLAVVALTTVASFVGAADPECIYRKIRGLSPHWPKPLSCSTYYRCSSKNTVRTVTCPLGKEYNPKSGRCSRAGRGLCKLSLIAPLAEVILKSIKISNS